MVDRFYIFHVIAAAIKTIYNVDHFVYPQPVKQAVRVATQYAPAPPALHTSSPPPVHSLHALHLRRPARLLRHECS